MPREHFSPVLQRWARCNPKATGVCRWPDAPHASTQEEKEAEYEHHSASGALGGLRASRLAADGSTTNALGIDLHNPALAEDLRALIPRHLENDDEDLEHLGAGRHRVAYDIGEFDGIRLVAKILYDDTDEAEQQRFIAREMAGAGLVQHEALAAQGVRVVPTAWVLVDAP